MNKLSRLIVLPLTSLLLVGCGGKVITGADLPALAADQSESHTLKSEGTQTRGSDYDKMSSEVVFYSNDVFKAVDVLESKIEGEETKEEAEVWLYHRDGVTTFISYVNDELQSESMELSDPSKLVYNQVITSMEEGVVQALFVAVAAYTTFLMIGTEEGNALLEEEGIDPADLVLKDMGGGVYRLEGNTTDDEGVNLSEVAEVGVNDDGLITHFLVDQKASKDGVETETLYTKMTFGRGTAPAYNGNLPELPA
ncbi:MAG: hypothetical protein LBR37_02655 [Erysipelotrichaceae bacterium]|nr:hypothetical protein [Erysipelotrichaceae bacterium]